jgi:UDP-N-acetylmuramoylalanine--D-glutamate ligase
VITSETWCGKRYAVLGLARSGQATVRALLASGAEVVAWDSDPVKCDVLLRKQEPGSPELLLSQEHISFADPLTLDLTGFTAVVVSPGVPLNHHPIAAQAAKYGVPVIGDIELFAQARAELPPHKVVGITGTNGKSTTTALVHHILQTAGVPTTMGGNIGLPILGQEPLPEGGVYVLELSSYQIDLTFTLDCDVAVLLNITPDHLDRYEGFEAYARAKFRLFDLQSADHFAVADDRALYDFSPWAQQNLNVTTILICDAFDHKFPSLRERSQFPTLQGPHNLDNLTAAAQVCHLLGLREKPIWAGLATYPGLPHRMERIRELDGVLFVNDSKATNPTSTAPALAAYPAVHWILGGQAKTDELDACAPHFGHVRAAYTIGESAAMFADLLRPHMPVEQSGTLAKAVTSAAAAAKAGETVLLSPACASFDQFRDYEDRGDQFRSIVGAL